MDDLPDDVVSVRIDQRDLDTLIAALDACEQNENFDEQAIARLRLSANEQRADLPQAPMHGRTWNMGLHRNMALRQQLEAPENLAKENHKKCANCQQKHDKDGDPTQQLLDKLAPRLADSVVARLGDLASAAAVAELVQKFDSLKLASGSTLQDQINETKNATKETHSLLVDSMMQVDIIDAEIRKFEDRYKESRAKDAAMVSEIAKNIHTTRELVQGAVERAEAGLDTPHDIDDACRDHVASANVRGILREHLRNLKAATACHNIFFGYVKDPKFAEAVCNEIRRPHGPAVRVSAAEALEEENGFEIELTDRLKTVTEAIEAKVEKLEEHLEPVDDLVQGLQRLNYRVDWVRGTIKETGQTKSVEGRDRQAAESLANMRTKLQEMPFIRDAVAHELSRDPKNKHIVKWMEQVPKRRGIKATGEVFRKDTGEVFRKDTGEVFQKDTGETFQKDTGLKAAGRKALRFTKSAFSSAK